MYPEGTTKVVANFTPRSGKWAPEGINYVVPWGVRLIPYLITRYFNDNFFYPHTNDLYYTIHNMKTNTLSSSQSSALQNTHAIRKRQQALDGLKITLSDYTNGDIDFSHFEELQKHGELPIKWKVLESTRPVPFGTPVLTIENTVPEFYWVPNFLETIISNLLWKPMTSATIASAYYKLLSKYAFLTTGKTDFVKYQAHDFSFRGMDSPTAAVLSGLGHCLFFNSSDTIPVAQFIRQNYPLGERGLFKIVPATEHSVMCAGTQEGEGETFDRLMKIYPKGLLSVVSDTWDLWKVITEIIASRKDKIMARDGKLVIRPDSGDPVDIICGTDIETSMDTDRSHLSPEEKGVVELLWDIFGGSVTKQGFKVLHDCIGTIYGDSITLKRAEDICERLARKGFASINVVFGIGSYTYQYNTRDTSALQLKLLTVK
jgi:nicotinamide phosphoribosyltransferase